jgi:hypothetical protein
VPISIDLTNYKEMDALENELSKKQTVRNEEKIR